VAGLCGPFVTACGPAVETVVPNLISFFSPVGKKQEGGPYELNERKSRVKDPNNPSYSLGYHRYLLLLFSLSPFLYPSFPYKNKKLDMIFKPNLT